jgi:hypothetical protein
MTKIFRYAGSVCLGALLVLAAVTAPSLGCKSSSGNGSKDGGGEGSAGCTTAGNSSGGAIALTSGQSIQSKICFAGTSNWFVVDVPSGDTLLDISAGYPASANSPVDLDIKVYSLSGTTLTQLECTTTPCELVAPSGADGGANAIQTTVQTLTSGKYYLQIADQHNSSFDPTNSYTLKVATAKDPDTHEPNDTNANAKPSDSSPGYLAYLGDVDIFETKVSSADELLTLSITNPKNATFPIDYSITTSSGAIVGTGTAIQQTAATTQNFVLTAADTYYVALQAAAGSVPDRTAGYTVTFGSTPNPDTVNNHTFATAVCPGGGTSPCTMAYAGAETILPAVSSYISVGGQHDYYRVDVTSGAALVLDVNLTSSSTSVKYAVDILTADPNSSCMADSDCVGLNKQCSEFDGGTSGDCELSHACLQPGNYNFCPGGITGAQCQLCAGAGLCIPQSGGSGGFCAIPQYLSSFSPNGTKIGGPNVATAQPLFSNGTYYINVHDANYTGIDLKNPYSLTLKMEPEPDPYDQSTVATSRNNFYDPYPSSMSNESPNLPLAVPLTLAELATGVSGWISYQADDDWFTFPHPCPGMDCALEFNWTQPGPSKVQVAFYMIDNDGTSLNLSFAYNGDPTKLTMPMPGTLDNMGGDCHNCSVALATADPDGGPVHGKPYMYYLRVADVSQTHWDYTTGGKYTVSMAKGADGCPASCSFGPNGCGCYCKADMNCPAPNF